MASIPSTSKTSIGEILPRTGAKIGDCPRRAGTVRTVPGVDHQGLAVVQRAVLDAVRAVALGEAVALADPGAARRRAVRDDREADQPEAVIAGSSPGSSTVSSPRRLGASTQAPALLPP